MAKKLNWEEVKELQKKIIESDRYANTFFINDIDEGKFGSDYDVYSMGNVHFLHWKNTDVVVFAEGEYDGEEAVAFLDTLPYSAVNGMGRYTDPIAEVLGKRGFKVNRSEMMYVDHESFRKIPRSDGCRLMLAPEDFEKMADLYATSEDFNLHLEDELDREDWACDMAEKEYPFASVGYYVKKRLVAASYLAGCTRRSAMVVGVYVHPDFENRGIGTAMMSELTDLALNENLMEYLTLFYSTEKARHVYEKLGYRTIGSHNFIKRIVK